MKPRYVRFTKLTFDPANYAAMIDYRDNTIVPKLNEMQITGLVRVRMIKVSDNEVITLAAYDTTKNYTAAAPIKMESGKKIIRLAILGEKQSRRT